jgi:hypothetical protein
MAHLTINVPEELVDDLRRELRRAHARRAAALQRALDAYLASRGPLDDIDGALVELRDLDEALGQLPVAAAPLALTAHPEVLADALSALLAVRPADAVLRALVRSVEWGSR